MNAMNTPDLATALSDAHRTEIATVMHRAPTSGPLRRAIGLQLVRTGLKVLRSPIDGLGDGLRDPRGITT